MNECLNCGHRNRDDLDNCSDCGIKMFDGEEDLRKEGVKEND